MKTSLSLPLVTVDPIPDANGFATLRPADRSPHGDTDAQPIATVYSLSHAAEIAQAVNSHAVLLATCKELLFRFDHTGEDSPEDAEVLDAARAVINRVENSQ